MKPCLQKKLEFLLIRNIFTFIFSLLSIGLSLSTSFWLKCLYLNCPQGRRASWTCIMPSKATHCDFLQFPGRQVCMSKVFSVLQGTHQPQFLAQSSWFSLALFLLTLRLSIYSVFFPLYLPCRSRFSVVSPSILSTVLWLCVPSARR